MPDLLSPVSGSVIGSEIVARLCDGGAYAYLQRTSPTTSPPNKLLVNISSGSLDPSRDFRIALPTDAIRLQLGITIGLNGAQPGTYTNTDGSSCGGLDVCAIFPPPASVQCPAVTESDVCPTGCTFAASPSNGCVPVNPATCYEADTDPDCNGRSPTTPGSWHLTLSSVAPYVAPDGGATNYDFFVIHGDLDATLVRTDSGAGVDAGAIGPSTASLSLHF